MQGGRRKGPREVKKQKFSGRVWKGPPERVKAPSVKSFCLQAKFPSTAGHEKSVGNSGRPLSKAKYFQRPIANEYREGKVKRTPGGE